MIVPGYSPTFVPSAFAITLCVWFSNNPSVEDKPVTSCLFSLYVNVALFPTNSTVLLLIVSVPSVVFTVNWDVTLFPAASVTTAVPVTFIGYVPAFVSVADADNPLTVYVFPSIVNVVCFNPLTLCSLPLYVVSLLFATTSISYFWFQIAYNVLPVISSILTLSRGLNLAVVASLFVFHPTK